MFISVPSLVVAGAAGQELIVAADSNLPSLTGYGVQIISDGPSGTSRGTMVATVAGDGLVATYLIKSTDFPVGGVYSIQAVATLSGTVISKSEAQNVIVQPGL